MADEYDLLIVGGGLAGLTAALYGARYGLRTCLVEQMAAGGQVLNVEKIENFPGFPQGIAGFDLGPIVQEQAEAAGAEFTMDTAIGLDVDGDRRVVRCEGAEFVARSVIVASGSAFRALGIPGETEYVGRGVSHCAACDAPFFVGKDVAVIGGGDSALDEAAVLAAQVRRVTVVHRGASFRAQQVAVDRLSALSNVSTLFNTEVAEIVGGDTVSSVRLRSIHVRGGGSGGSNASSGSGGVGNNGGGSGSSGGSGSGGSGGSGSGGDGGLAELALSGVFIFVGLEPNTAWLRGVVDQDAAGHVVVDQHLQTSVAGVFAAGDLRQASSRQLVAAAGDGATAAVFAARYLREGRR